jgi:hypothetical protein
MGSITIFLGARGAEPTPLVGPDPPITDPKAFYVYFHRDAAGAVFYIGKGQGRRAWTPGRGPLWARYVAERSAGKFTVEIFRDGMTDEDAEGLEQSLISEHGARLVNVQNFGRPMDFEALELFHRLRNANRALYWPGKSDTKSIERSDPEEAIRRYRLAILQMPEYARINLEPTGLVAELSGPHVADDPYVLDRLTLCLERLTRYDEIETAVESYFREFPESVESSAGQQVLKRLAKIRRKTPPR